MTMVRLVPGAPILHGTLIMGQRRTSARGVRTERSEPLAVDERWSGAS
jgi:hypothetical protein